MKDKEKITKECLELIDYLNKIGIVFEEVKEIEEVK